MEDYLSVFPLYYALCLEIRPVVQSKGSVFCTGQLIVLKEAVSVVLTAVAREKKPSYERRCTLLSTFTMAPRCRARKTLKTTFAIFSGYDMSRQTFIDMATQMPALRSELGDGSVESLFNAYDSWREQHRAPQVMSGFPSVYSNRFFTMICVVLYEGDEEDQDEDEDKDEDKDEDNEGDDEGDEAFASVTSFFVPTRYIDYTDESQLEDAEKAPFAKETEKDKAILASFLRCVQDHGGLQFDTTKIRFRWVKDYHPYYIRSVCLLHALRF